MKYLVLLLSFAFLFTSCEKDTSIIREEIEIEPAEEIEDLLIRGSVTDQNLNKIPNSQVNIYVNYELVDEFLSDENGKFEFTRIKDSNENLRIHVVNEGYDPILRTIPINQGNILDLELELPNTGESGILAQLDPRSKELVSISGYCYGSTGLPARVVVASYKLENERPENFTASYTDKNGFFEFFREPERNITVQYNENLCEANNLILLIHIEEDDLILEDYISNDKHEIVQENITFLNCNGDPISRGKFELHGYNTELSSQIIEGKINYEFTTCELNSPDVDFIIRNCDDNQILYLENVTTNYPELDLGDIEVCGNQEPSFNISLGGISFPSKPSLGEITHIRNENSSLPTSGTILINADDGQVGAQIWYKAQNGIYYIDSLRLFKQGDATNTRWESTGENLMDLQLELDKIAPEFGDYTLGSINGSFFNEHTEKNTTIELEFNLFTLLY